MAKNRAWLHGSLSVALLFALASNGWAQAVTAPTAGGAIPSTKPAESKAACCKVYSLADLGEDPNLCKWIADTIPDVIQPGSWVYAGGALGGGEAKRTISYFAPAKVLVINHTPAVHAQVDEFLQNLKKSVAQSKAAKREPQILPATFTMPDNPRPMPVQGYQSSYVVPPSVQAPKHLFHFIIRYEGAGVVDKNVVSLIKAQSSSPSNCPITPYITPSMGPTGSVEASDPLTPASNLQPRLEKVPAPGKAPYMPPADPATPAVLPSLQPPPASVLPHAPMFRS